MSEERANWRAIGSEPISTENPSGESARYEPEFERLEAEMQKMESLAGDAVDWKKVVSLSREILKNKSKDLLVGSYLALGLLETEGCNGLSNGLACIEGLVSDHWPSLFPAAKRMRARINALNWLSEKAGASLARSEANRENAQGLSDCEELTQSLEALLNEKADPGEPVFRDLERTIQEQLSQLTPAGGDAVATEAKPAGKTAAVPAPLTAVPATPPVSKVESTEDAKRLLKDAFGSLKKVASFTRGQDLTRPLSYRLIRFLTWSEIDALPPAESGKSRIPPPPQQLRERFQTLSEESAWEELIIQAESKVAEFPFWLDLHRISETALTKLGSEYSKAGNALKSEVSTLLDRLPDLIEIEFSDGTPFADDSTRNWISTRIFPKNESKKTDPAPSDNEKDSLAEIWSKSRQLLLEGDTKAALSLVQEATRSAATERQKFLAQLELANICLETGHTKAALAHFEMIDERIKRFSLDIWEPDLASKVLEIYWHTLKRNLRESKQAGPELTQLADSVYSRLCRLDVLAGLDATKGK